MEWSWIWSPLHGLQISQLLFGWYERLNTDLPNTAVLSLWHSRDKTFCNSGQWEGDVYGLQHTDSQVNRFVVFYMLHFHEEPSAQYTGPQIWMPNHAAHYTWIASYTMMMNLPWPHSMCTSGYKQGRMRHLQRTCAPIFPKWYGWLACSINAFYLDLAQRLLSSSDF